MGNRFNYPQRRAMARLILPMVMAAGLILFFEQKTGDQANPAEQLSITAEISALPTPTVELLPIPTPTPSPSQRMATARRLQSEGRYEVARYLFADIIADTTNTEITHHARFRLGQSYLADGHYTEAAITLAQAIDQDAGTIRRRQAQFLLAEAEARRGEQAAAIEDYKAYLEAGGTAQSETLERIAQAYRELKALDKAESSYEQAILAAPDTRTALRLREIQAQIALDQGLPEKAVVQYEQILTMAQSPAYITEILYKSGEALRAAGRKQEAIQQYQTAADTMPTSSFAHSSIVALLELGAPVDEYQRGVINYYNDVNALAVAALNRYIAADPTGRNGQAYYFLGRTYNAMGRYKEAVAAWDRVIQDFPQCPCWGDAWLRRAEAQAALGDSAAARAGLIRFADGYPQNLLAAEALLRAARLIEADGDCTTAAEAYRGIYARYPSSQQSAKGLFAAGICMYREQRWEDAATDWRNLQGRHPTSDLTDASRLWFGKALLAAGQTELARDNWKMLALKPETYYGQRALTLAQKANLQLEVAVRPAPPPGPSDQDDAETWLRSWLQESPPGDLSVPPPELTSDPSLLRGRELLELGLVKQGLDELNRLYQRYNQDPLALYRLSLLFSEVEAYRLSIASAERLIKLSPGVLMDAPLFIQRLAFPIYFAELIETEAAQRGIDPLLLYALLRQESLFEASATSSAEARGLMQIIPPTGEWIAGQLGWPGYSEELLYRPYISIKFGAYYLQTALKMLNNNITAALAGYNAGPGNATRWLKSSAEDDDQFFINISFSESRLYIERIVAYHATYRRLYMASTSNPSR